MKIEEARVAAYTAIQAAVQTITPIPPVQWDNRNLIDPSNQTAPYIAVDFVIQNAEQMSLGATKVVRYTGVIALIVCLKQGSGIATATVMLDKLCLALGMKSFGSLYTHAASPLRPVLEDGWHIQPLSVPMWFDDIVVD